MTELQYKHLTLQDQYVSHNNLTKNFNRDPANVYVLKYMINDLHHSCSFCMKDCDVF